MSNLTEICIEHRKGIQRLNQMCNELLGDPSYRSRLYPLVLVMMGFIVGALCVAWSIEKNRKNNEVDDKIE